MISRYEIPEIAAIWSEDNKYRKWLDVELAIAEEWFEKGEIPAASWNNIREKAAFDASRIGEIEQLTKHDIIAFLTSVEEFLGPDSAYLHKGVTSYDIVDTALGILLRESLLVVELEVARLKRILLDLAFKHSETMMIGRTHGVHAEPMTAGLKFLLWYEELLRNEQRLKRAEEVVAVGKISGAVGTYSCFPPESEENILKRLALSHSRVSNQVLQRDRHAEMMSALAILATLPEKIATEIRHLQRTEVLELEEPFTKGQKGSSAMPHKKNPVRCERICGLARLLRGNLTVALENNALWHERDISHSSTERVIFPDSFHTIVFILRETSDILGQLVVNRERMLSNMEAGHYLFFSQKVLTAIVEKGIARQKAYELVQRIALQSWNEKKSFPELVKSDAEISSLLDSAELSEIFDFELYLRPIREIFRRFEKDNSR